jgi:hypothetical protein
MLMIQWDIADHMARKGWKNASQLAIGAGLTYPTASRVVKANPVAKIETATLETLARAFGVRNPLSLLKHTPE